MGWRAWIGLSDCRPAIRFEHTIVILAYIDPGAGSMVIQALLAGALAVPFLFRTHLRRALDRVRGLLGRDQGET